MKKLHLIHVLFLGFSTNIILGQNQAVLTCIEPELFYQMGDWQGSDATISISIEPPTSDNSFYLRMADRPAEVSSKVYNSETYKGDYSVGNYCLCWDYKVFDDGYDEENENDDANINPRIIMYRGDDPNHATLQATYVSSINITENSDWVNICAHIHNDLLLLQPGQTGGWAMAAGSTQSDWQDLIEDVSGFAFIVDVAGSMSQNERLGLDNFCLSQCVECDVEVSFQLEDENGIEKTTYCLGEDVYFNGSATTSWNGQSYYIDLHIVNEDGTLTWVGDQYYTGWVTGQPGVENITKLFENDPEVPVVFQPNTTYYLKLAIDDVDCGWMEHIETFVYTDPIVSFQLEDEVGNEKSIFCFGEQVYLNGSATPPWNGQSYYIDLHIVNEDGTLTWVGDQETDGWVSGTPDLIDITKLFENDPEVPVVFLPNVTYEVKLAIDDEDCGWVEQTQTFEYYEPTVISHLENEEGEMTTTFCLDEDVYLNGSATPPWNGQSYYIDLHIVNGDGSLTWVGDQDVTGWVSGTPDLINITKLFENDPEVPVVFQSNTTYQIKLAIDDQLCGWAEHLTQFTIEDCCSLGPVVNLQANGSTLSWHPVPGAAGYVVESTSSWPADCNCSNPISIIPITTTGTSVTLPLNFNNCTSVHVKAICSDGSLSLPSDGICVRMSLGLSRINEVETTISPNPNRGTMYIKVDTHIDSENISLNVYNTSGLLIHSEEGLKSNNGILDHTLSLSSQLDHGIYFIMIAFDDEIITKQVIVE